MKNIFPIKIILLLLVLLISSAFSKDKGIVVIYPKPDQVIGAVDSTFILGHLPKLAKDELYDFNINGIKVDVHPDGGFLAFIPIEPGQFTFHLEAVKIYKKDFKKKIDGLSGLININTDNIIKDSLTVQVPEPLVQGKIDSLYIDPHFHNQFRFKALKTGDRLRLMIKGTPLCQAWFSIASIADSIPMAETDPRTQAYWGESVFGNGAVPDSLLIKGIYSGYLDVTDEMRGDSLKVTFFLKPPSVESIIKRFLLPPLEMSELNLIPFLKYTDSDIVSIESYFKVNFNDPAYPMTVRFTDSVQTIRYGPRKGYFSIFQPEGVEAEVVGCEDDWYIAQLSETQKAWIFKNSVEILPHGILPPQSFLRVVRYYAGDSKIRFEFPLSGKHPYRIIEVDQKHLKIQLFGVTSDTDWIRYTSSEKLIDLVSWQQVEPELYELNIKLTQNIWGYDAFYEGNTFYLDIKKPPENLSTLKGKRIVIDPGHSSDPGSIGPTGLTEKEANLGIALKLAERLRDKGATVIMTRSDSSHVDLYDRPAIAKANQADLFVSIHNNALPDGVNPFVNNGASCYYYHPHSINLARAIQKEMLKETKQKDYGLYHGNLAVNRPTQYPAVLVECAFMIIPEQEAMLKTKDFQKKCAKAITNGIEKFLKEFKDD